jgi:GR25 family glycosyltransferase involved in LPS biosynthesis
MKRLEIGAIIFICLTIVLVALWNGLKKDWKNRSMIERFYNNDDNKQENDDNQPLSEMHDVRSWVINLDKNKSRWKNVSKSYNQSDMVPIPITRFPAVVGSKLNPKIYLSEDALKELELNEKRGYRTRHYQLSRGGIGCFLSHYELMKKLMETDNDMYLIFEDDIKFPKNTQAILTEKLNKAPKDWDIILFGFSRMHGYKEGDDFIKAMGFWGTSSYVINRRGAMKFLKECDIHKMDAQIDAFMSYLSQKGKLNVYATSERIIPNTDEGSDIQFQGVRTENNEDPFMYRGLVV